MLPEFSLDQAQRNTQFGDDQIAAQLNQLKNWLASKETETNRQVKPAWIEIYWALITLLEQRLHALPNQGTEILAPDETIPAESTSEQSLSQDVTNRYLFESHIVARQVARQRDRRQLPTRFVTDEIKRISHHQQDFIRQHNHRDATAVIGWYRTDNKRGLGIAFFPTDAAAQLVIDDSLPSHSKQNPAASEKETKESPPFSKLSFAFIAVSALVLLLWLNLWSNPTSTIDTLSAIKQEQKMRCGVDGLLPHFSLRNDAEQTWWGLDVELCKALGAALEVEVEFVKVSASRFEQRIASLEDHKVHILFRNTSHTIVRDLNSKIVFGPNYFYEKEFFLDFQTKPAEPLIELAELNNKSICVKPGTSNELTLRHLQHKTSFQIITQDQQQEDLIDNIKLLRVLRDDQSLCDLVFGNYYILKQLKADQERRYPNRPISMRQFELAGFDPLAPVLLRDHDWQVAVSYTIYALLYADKLGITSYNVDERYHSGSVVEQNFLRGKGMERAGLNQDWVFRIIAQVGNYSEIYFKSLVCDYVSCQKPSEHEFHQLMQSLDNSRWPNKVFKENDTKPGLLHTPKF